MKMMEEKQSSNIFINMSICAPMPCHTTLSRRSQTLKELQEQLKKVQKKESIHILIENTGLKIYGAGHLCTNAAVSDYFTLDR